ncbi:MAG: DNA-binding CsgD family transcriptional regulator [Cocleimonas sp.]|jgi:DNA-binding CsgD family transcriptional regulator
MMPKKPSIPKEIMTRWRRLVNIMGQVTDISAALITQIHPETIEMLISSDSKNNPYTAGEATPRRCGLYCDWVVDKNLPLLVNDASQDKAWCNNPDMEHNLTFYLGYPLCWPDGEAFGTICVLDVKNNLSAKKYRNLIEEFQTIVNQDLAFILNQSLLQYEHDDYEKRLAEQRSKIKNRANDLVEINTAMRVLLNHREKDKDNLQHELLDEIRQSVKPWIEKLERTVLEKDQQLYIDQIRDHLSDSSDLPHKFWYQLTGMEQEVAKAISQGLSSKLIASRMFVEKSTIDFHRQNIRQKLGLTSSKTSLKSFLLSFEH